MDAKHARRLPVFTAALIVLDGAVAEKGAERFEEWQVAPSHRHREDELHSRRAVAIRATLSNGREGSLARDEAAQREAGPSDHFEKSWKKLVEAMGLEPTDLLHAMQALYQLSYAPRVDQRTSGDSRLECVADRTHVRSVARGCDDYRVR